MNANCASFCAGASTPNIQLKKAMLEQEGVKIDGSCVADAAAVMAPDDF